MNSLKRNQRILYLCKRYIDENNITKFDIPKAIYINWQEITSDSEVLGIGIEYSKYIRIKGTKNEVSKFDYKDRVFVYVRPDVAHFDELCNNADYEVDNSPLITLNEGEILLRKLSGSEE